MSIKASYPLDQILAFIPELCRTIIFVKMNYCKLKMSVTNILKTFSELNDYFLLKKLLSLPIKTSLYRPILICHTFKYTPFTS